jgi:hypothetical protein
METIGKVFARAEKAEARVKELESELSKLKKAYDVVSAYATHFTPDHKLEDKLKELNEAYNTEQFKQTQSGGAPSAKRIDYRGDDE